LVRARDREWVVVDASDATFLLARPLAGADEDITALAPSLEPVQEAKFPPPTVEDLGDATAAGLLRDGLRIGFRASGGPFRSLAGLAVTPRAYQYVPLLMALRQGGDAVRLLIADGVGIGKTVEAGLVAAELLAQGDAKRLAVLCSPALAPQWRDELRTKFNIDATLVLPSTVNRLQRGLAMGESLFDRNPYVVVSTDLIKQRTYRDEFARACPDLVIVDEAHTSVTAGGANSRGGATLRHHLLRRLADDKSRHLILLTATPHQGDDDGWRALLALLDPALEHLPSDLSGAQHDGARTQLARYFVQRQRADITDYLDEDTPFPDRATTEETYNLHPDYRALLDRVLAYARESVTDSDVLGTVRQRVRWWSMVALLRSLASSPAAAATTLRNRAATQEAATDTEADEIGRAAVMDEDDEASTDADDIAPGADDTTDQPSTSSRARSRLLEFARQAEALHGPAKDRKLARVTDMVTRLLDDGFDPIVFCRYIPTADYVGDHLRKTLGKRARVETVTGNLPPEAREAAVGDLGEHDGPRILVATDCLSEGVNLQDYFTAVVHYDLAWNPTRHEQREGRIDRFGQRAKTVRAVTYYGVDNPVDGVVLNVLLRKHEAIKKSTGVSVAMPTDSALVMQAVFEGLILRGQDPRQEALFDVPGFTSEQELFDTWQHTAERERRSRSRFAQHTINPQEVALELASVRDSLGGPADVERFVRHTLARLSSTLIDLPDGSGFMASLAPLPRALRDMLPADPRAVDITFVRDLPAPLGAHVLARTDLAVEALASYTLDAALDPLLAADFRPARRSGVMRTTAVSDTTTLLVTRMRFHLTLPGRDRDVPLVVEEAHLAAFTGTPHLPTWLDRDALVRLLDATPSGNVPETLGKALIAPILDTVDSVLPHLSDQADKKAEELADAHRRVRESARTAVRGLRVQAQRPADILGVYTFLPGGTA
jgi:superfamily II DNA or RNA helicase